MEFVLETRYLKSLIAVVETGSIADAARSEHLTPAAVGQRVRALEQELGLALLSRRGYTAQPTQACLALLPRARRLVRDAAQLRDDVDAAGLSGTLRVGAISTALTGLIPAALRRFTELAPQGRCTIVPGTSQSLYQSLQSGELDAVIIVAPPFELPKTLRAQTLRREPLALLAAPDLHQRLDGEPAALLSARPYIRYDPKAWGGRFAAQWLVAQGLDPEVLCDLDALETIAILVADDMGVALLPQWAGMERLTGGCRLSPLPGAAWEREILLLAHSEPERPQLLAVLASALGEQPM